MEKTISTPSACRPFAADTVTVPFITGDGIGGEITPAMQQVIDKAVAEAYGGKKNIRWMEVQAGQRAYDTLGTYLPEETLKAFADHHVGIKGPLTTLSAAASARSTWPCARDSTSMSGCAPCVISRASPLP